MIDVVKDIAVEAAGEDSILMASSIPASGQQMQMARMKVEGSTARSLFGESTGELGRRVMFEFQQQGWGTA